MKLIASPPKLLITVLMIPTLGDRNRINIPHMTMVEMKFGAYVMVWITFRYLLCRNELSISASRIGIGKDTIRP